MVDACEFPVALRVARDDGIWGASTLMDEEGRGVSRAGDDETKQSPRCPVCWETLG